MPIQIKRSSNTAVPPALANGEPAFTSAGNVLFIGVGGSVLPIAGERNPGILTPNQAIVTDSSNFIDRLNVANSILLGNSNGSSLTLTIPNGGSRVASNGSLDIFSNNYIKLHSNPNSAVLSGAAPDSNWVIVDDDGIYIQSFDGAGTTVADITVEAGGINIFGNVTPFVPNTHSLGNTSFTWRNVYAGNLISVGITSLNTTGFAVGSSITGNTSRFALGTSVGIQANGSVGTSGQVLTSNGTTVFWATPTTGTVSQVDTGNGLAGGPVTSTGTVSVLANTGIVANTTGVFVNTAFIGTLTANNTTNFGGLSLATVQSQITGNAATAYTNAISDTNNTLTQYARVANAVFTGNAVFNHNANTGNVIIRTAGGINANGSYGTSGQVLTSNGTTVFWTTPTTGTVTQVSNGAGLVGGPINTTGTLAVLANSGIVANTTGVFVNAAFIGTLTANNTSFVGTVSAANVVSNAQLSANLANYQTTAGLASNVATLTSNNSTNFGGLSLATVQGQISGNAATAYSNAVSYVTAQSFVNTSQLSSNLALYAQLSGAVFTGAVTTNNLTVTGNLVLQGNTVIIGANNLVVNDAVISLHSPANGSALTSNDGRNIGISFHYYDTEDRHGALLRDNSTGRLVWYTDSTDPNVNTDVVGTALGTIQANTFYAGNSTVFATVNATSYTGTSNNSTNFGGLSLATLQGQITGNAATAYTNAIAYVTAQSFVNTSQLSANVSTLQGQITSNAATAYTNSVAYVDSRPFVNTAQLSANVTTLQGQITSNAATAYTNAVAYVDSRPFVNTSQLSANVSTLQSQISGNAATAYTNAIAYVTAQSFVNTSQLSANVSTLQGQITANAATAYSNAISDTNNTLTQYARVANAIFTGNSTFNHNANTGNVIIRTTGGINANGSYGTSGQVLTSNGTTVFWTTPSSGGFTNGQSISVNNFTLTGAFTANSSNGAAGQILISNGSGAYWGPAPTGGGGTVTQVSTGSGLTGGPITTSGTISVLANTGLIANSTGVFVNSAYIATIDVNNATNFGGLSLATVQGQITSNAATAYSNAVAYVTAQLFVNTSQLSSNLALYQTTAGLAANVATLTSNNSTNFGGLSLATVQGQITSNAATAYTNSVNYVTAQSFVNTSQLSANLSLYQTTAGLAANVATLTANNSTNFGGLSLATVQGQITGNAATAFSNATAFASNATNLSSGTVNNARLPSAINVTSVNAATLSVGTLVISNTTGTFVNGSINLTRNDTRLTFTPVAGGANVYFVQQSDDNFVLYTTNTSGGTKAVFNVYANTNAPNQNSAIRFNVPIDLGTQGVYANNSLGSAGQILISSGSGTYWGAAPAGGGGTVTQVSTGSGLTGGPITTSGTVSVLANSGIVSNATGVFVNANTGVVANSTGVFVNASHIATLTANNSTNFDGLSLATVQGQITGNAATAYTNSVNYVIAQSFVNTSQLTSNLANYVTTTNLTNNLALYATIANPTFTGNVTTGNVIINATGGIRANGSFGTAGQVLHTNGTGVYWDTDDQGVTSVATGSGLTGGTITTTGTVSVLANSGIVANTTGVFVNANSGIVANTTGVFVNTAFIGTLTANNSTNFNGQPASFYANATNLTSGTLDNARLPGAIAVTSVNAAALTVGTIIVANTLGFNTTANLTITSTSELIIANGAGIQANGGFGTAGQVLSSNGTGVYWATASGGGGGRIDPRVSSTTSAASVTPDISSFDMYVYTALATGLTINATTSGSPLNGNKLTFRFKDNGTSRGLTWTTAGSNSFRAIGVTLPTSTTINKVTYVGCIYNATESFWDVVAVLTQA